MCLPSKVKSSCIVSILRLEIKSIGKPKVHSKEHQMLIAFTYMFNVLTYDSHFITYLDFPGDNQESSVQLLG